MVCPATSTPDLIAYINFLFQSLNAEVAHPGGWVPTDATCHVVGINSRCETNDQGLAAITTYGLSANAYTTQVEIVIVYPHQNVIVTLADVLASGAVVDVVDVGQGAHNLTGISLPIFPGFYSSLVAFSRPNNVILSQHTWSAPKCLG